jgi:hypothetical protein
MPRCGRKFCAADAICSVNGNPYCESCANQESIASNHIRRQVIGSHYTPCKVDYYCSVSPCKGLATHKGGKCRVHETLTTNFQETYRHAYGSVLGDWKEEFVREYYEKLGREPKRVIQPEQVAASRSRCFDEETGKELKACHGSNDERRD